DPLPHDRRAGRDPAPHQDLRQPAAGARPQCRARRERRGRHRRRAERWVEKNEGRKEFSPPHRGGVPAKPAGWSIPEILELQRNIGDRLAHQRDRRLEIVLFSAGDAHRGSLDARLDFHLRVLEEPDDALRLLLLDAGLDVDRLLHLGADFLDRLRVEHPRVHAALRALREENVRHLLQLEIVVRVERQRQFGLLDARVRALEVEAVRDLLVRLPDRVLQLDLVDFGDDIEGRHGPRLYRTPGAVPYDSLTSMESTAIYRKPKKWIAAVLGLLIQPVGMLYVARPGWAAVYLALVAIIALGNLFVLRGGLAGDATLLLVAIICAIHAYRLARDYRAITL